MGELIKDYKRGLGTWEAVGWELEPQPFNQSRCN